MNSKIKLIWILFFKFSPYRLAFSSDPKLIETVTEGVKHILQSCLLAGTVQTVVITSRDFDNLYGGNITLQYVVKFMSFFCFIKTITHFSEIGR